jgi:membrane fusion protein, hemolysin D
MKSFHSVPALQSEASQDKLIRLFQSETAEIDEAPEPTFQRATLWLVGVLFVILLVVTIVMPIGRVVTSTSGEIVTADPTIVVQALDPSIIKTIKVAVGDRVEKGGVLATLDPTFAAADVNALRLQLASLDAQIARCKAELAKVPYDPGPAATSYAIMQKGYYQQRKSQFDAQVHAYNEQIDQLRASIVKLEADMRRYADRAALNKKIENMRAALAAKQVGSKLVLLQATDQTTEIMRQVEYDKNSLVETRHQLASAMATRDAYVQQWFAQTSQELVTAEGKRDDAREQLDKATLHKDLVQMSAPEDAVVLKVDPFSVGSVLQPGTELFRLAPLRSTMQAELHIQPQDIGFIRVGDSVTIKLDPFDYIEHGTVSGKVRSITDGAFTVDSNGQATAPYYKVSVALSAPHLRDVPEDFRLIPGMTLTGDVHVGSRSLIMYLLHGIVRGVGESMREP